VPAALQRVLAIFPELEVKLGVPAKSLSGGQKQMVCIAQALIVPPRYLVIDELSLGLAPDRREAPGRGGAAGGAPAASACC
jgi:branched-chain amino acid transport system ATP-binding protein